MVPMQIRLLPTRRQYNPRILWLKPERRSGIDRRWGLNVKA